MQISRLNIAKDTAYWKELEKVRSRFRLAREVSRHFRDVSSYIPKEHRDRPNPLTQIHNAYNIKIDTTEYLSNRNYFSKLYRSMRRSGIQHTNLVILLNNPYVNAIRSWNKISNVRQQIIGHEYPEIPVVAKEYNKLSTSEGIDDCTIDFALFASGIKGIANTATTSWKLFFSRKVTESAVQNAQKIEKVTYNLTEAERKGFRGIRGKIELKTPKGMGRNPDRMINGKKYWVHALDRMQDRGIPMSAVENCIKTGKKIQSTKFASRWEYHDTKNNIKTIF